MPSMLVVQFQVPGYSLAFYYERNTEERGGASTEEDAAFDALLAAFCAGDDAFRNRRFKLVPKVVEGATPPSPLLRLCLMY